jgi:hypothetical protein
VRGIEELPKGNGIWIYFECENLDEYVNELIRKGIVFEETPNDKEKKLLNEKISTLFS